MRVAGEADHLTSSGLSDGLGAVPAGGTRWVEVEFTEVPFCDCAALGVLLRARQRAEAVGARLASAAPSSRASAVS